MADDKEISLKIRIGSAPETTATQRAVEKIGAAATHADRAVDKLAAGLAHAGKAGHGLGRADATIASMKAQFKAMGAQLDKVDAGYAKLREGYRQIGEEAERAERKQRQFWDNWSLSTDRLNDGIDRLKAGLFSVRNLMTTGIVGAVGYRFASSALRNAYDDAMILERTKRQFGEERGGQIAELAERLAPRAGIEGGAMLQAVNPIMDAVMGIRKGQTYKGKKLDEAGAEALKTRNFEFGAKLAARIATLTELPPEMVGNIVGAAGSGPEGMMMFMSQLRLRRLRPFVHELEKANRKAGGVAKLLGKEQAAKYNLDEKSTAGRGTILDIVLDRAGMTEKAAEDRRLKFDFQMRAIRSTIQDTFGAIGGSAIDRLNKGLAKGGSLAEKLQTYLASPRGKQMIDALGGALAKAVEMVASLTQKLPALIQFIDKHRTGLLALGAAYVGLRAVGQVRSLFGRAGFGGGRGGAPAGLPGGGVGDVLGGAGVQRVFVVNMPGGGIGGGPGGGMPGVPDAPGVPAAGKLSKLAKAGRVVKGIAGLAGTLLAGYETGSMLDDTLGISDAITGTKENAGGLSAAGRFAAEVSAKAEQEEANRRARGKAAQQALGPGGGVRLQTGNITVAPRMPSGSDLGAWLDGEVWPQLKTVMMQDMNISTAGGAAPLAAR